MLYFAYGSNMDHQQMLDRCNQAEFVTIGFVPNYEIYFPRKSINRNCGVASVRHRPNHNTWGVIYDLNEFDLTALDRSEGFREGRDQLENAYNRELLEISTSAGPLLALIYIANEQKNPPLPSSEYLKLLQDGAKHHDLPSEYQSYLAQLQHE